MTKYLAGVDVGKREHDVVIFDVNGKIIGKRLS